MTMRPHQRHRAPGVTYTLLDQITASPTHPMPDALRVHQLTRMYGGLRAIEQAEQPQIDDWRVCSDAVNLMETLVQHGHVQDDSGLLIDAVSALAQAGRRHRGGDQLRLDGAGIAAVRAVLEDYASAMEQLPHRVMVHCHRATERRIREIAAGRRQAQDVEVMSL
jgi:hypothetical protein